MLNKKKNFLSSKIMKAGRKSSSAGQMKIPRTVQESIPYKSAFPNGIIKTNAGMYSKTYPLQDVNFKTENDENQESMFQQYETLLNSIDSTMEAEVTIYNRNINEEAVKNSILIKPQKDTLNRYREEYNDILVEKLSEGKNNLSKEKYFTVSVEAENYELANNVFTRIDSELAARIRRINNDTASPCTIEERLGVLYDIYNPDEPLGFQQKIAKISNGRKLDLKALNRSGLTTKDIIGPSSMFFDPKYFMIGDTYGRSFFLDNLPTFLNTEILTDISNLSCNMLISIHYKPYQQDEAIKMIRTQTTNINMNVMEAEKKAVKAGYDPSLIPSELKRAKEEADLLMSDVMSRNQKIFKTSVVIVIFAKTMEELDQRSASLKSIGVGHLCQVKSLDMQQEIGLNAALPIGYTNLEIDRILTTESAAVFMPFSVQELSQRNGIYYGLNAVSKNLILYDRSSAKNYNGLILGKPGSGKSFIAKKEMTAILLRSSSDTVYVLDPENEYLPLAMAYGGERVRIAIGSDTHINPLDMDINYANGDDPIAMKCDFLVTMCESITKSRYGLTPIEISIIHRCGRKIYEPYMRHMQSIRETGITCDLEAMPTLSEFYDQLKKEPEAEAQKLAMALEIYCVGNYDLFSHRTNINTKSRFVVYDIKDIPQNLKELAMQICLNNIWNKIIENGKKGRRTWFYMDEFYLLTKTESSARFLQEIYKRARKWLGIPTGISQNVNDLLVSNEARTILANCDFVLMMNQSQIDRVELADIFNISPSLLEYITESEAGTGLLYNGTTIIPFMDSFPKNTALYQILKSGHKKEDGEKTAAS